MHECICCKMVHGEAPAAVVYEDDRTRACMDLGQVNPGHGIVTVQPPRQDLSALDETLAAAVLRTATRVAQAVKKALHPEGMTWLQAHEAVG